MDERKLGECDGFLEFASELSTKIFKWIILIPAALILCFLMVYVDAVYRAGTIIGERIYSFDE